MKKDILQLYWLQNSGSSAHALQKKVCYRDCAFSAVAMLEQIAQKLNTTTHQIAIAIYIVLIHKLLLLDHFNLVAKFNTHKKLIKPELKNNTNFSQLVKSIATVDIPKNYNIADYKVLFEIKCNKNKMLFCFEYVQCFLDDYFASTMVQRFRELLKKIHKDPNCQLDKLEIITSTEKKILQEWHYARTRYQKQKAKLAITEQQVMLIPERIVTQYLNQAVH